MLEQENSTLYKLLRATERYTKTDMVYLVSGSFWLGLGQVVSALSSLAVAIAFANLVSPETYGTYKYILSIAAIFAIFTLPGMSTAVARAVARKDTATIYAATRARLMWSLLGLVVACIGGGYYFFNDNSQLAAALIIIGITLPLFDTFTLYGAYLTGKREFKKQTTYHAITQIFSAFFVVGTLLFTDNLIIIILAYFVPLILVRFLFYRITAREFSHGEANAETIRYGKHLSLINILTLIAGNIDKVLLWKFLGPAQLAIYTFAIAIPEQLKGPLKGVGELTFPKFAEKSPEYIQQHLPSLWRKLFLYASILAILAFMYILAAPYIFQFLFPQYLDSVLYSQIVSISLISTINPVLTKLLEAQRKTKVQFILQSTRSLMLSAFFVVLIPLFGVWGGILAFVFTRMLSTIIYIGTVLYVFRPKLQI